MTLDVKRTALFAGPIFALFAAWLMLDGGADIDAALTLGITLWVVSWWIFEPIPIPATSLIPLALFPLLGVLTDVQVAEAYGDRLVLLLLGGFLLATALEKSGAHRRVALAMVRAFGGDSSRRLVFGFMAASAALSMWISNTATTLMLLPVAMAVLERTEDPKLPTALLLGIAYAASIGGIGTPIGTPPNVVFMGIYGQVTGNQIGFGTWMSFAVPVVLVFLPIAGFWLTRRLTHRGAVPLPEIGAWQAAEVRVLAVFLLTVALWVTRTGPFGGWTDWFGFPYSNDAIVAFVGVVLLFLIPNGKGGRLLDWETANNIPWGMLILFGAGLAIAKAFMTSGLSSSIGEALEALSTLHVYAMMASLCLAVTFLTEATSNTATTTLLMPILAAAAVGAGIDPKLLMIPAAMSASCAFMLPVATAPNVIVFSTGKFEIRTMASEGFALNLLGVGVISTMCYLIFA